MNAVDSTPATYITVKGACLSCAQWVIWNIRSGDPIPNFCNVCSGGTDGK